jgi:hypothetical protein
VLYLTRYELEYEPDEVVKVVRRPTHVGEQVARIVQLGSGDAVSEVWREGAWHRPGPAAEDFTRKRYVQPEELAELRIEP